MLPMAVRAVIDALLRRVAISRCKISNDLFLFWKAFLWKFWHSKSLRFLNLSAKLQDAFTLMMPLSSPFASVFQEPLFHIFINDKSDCIRNKYVITRTKYNLALHTA